MIRFTLTTLSCQAILWHRSGCGVISRIVCYRVAKTVNSLELFGSLCPIAMESSEAL